MRKIFLTVLVMLMTMSGCKAGENSENSIVATDKEMVKEVRNVGKFSGIKLLGSYDVIYKQGNTTRVEVEAPRKIMETLSTEVRGGILVISPQRNVKIAGVTVSGNIKIYGYENAKIYVTSPELDNVVLQGSGDICADGPVKADKLDIRLYGSGDIIFKNIEVKELDAYLKGSGDLRLSNVKAIIADIHLHGSGDLKSHFKDCGKLRSWLQGSGDITLSGKVGIYESYKTGAGDIDESNLDYAQKRTTKMKGYNADDTSVKSPNGIEAEP